MGYTDLSRWKDAEGLKQVRKGFAFDADHDQLFALGWPHIRLVAETEVDPYKLGLRLLRQKDFELRITWPRKLAAGLVRAWGQGQLFDMAPGSREFRQVAEEALWNMRKLTKEDVAAYVHLRMQRTPMWTDERATETYILLLEALSDTEWVAEAIVSWLEGLVFDELHELNTHPALITYQLGFLLLRLPKAKADKLRQRLKNVVEGNGNHPASRPKGQPSHIRSALLVLQGAAAADTLTDKDLRWYGHAIGQAEHILMRATINRLPTLPDARLVFLGGPDVLNTRFIQSWSSLSAGNQKWFYEQVSPIQHENVVHLMLGGVATGDYFGSAAWGWFEDHAAFAKPILEKLAASNTTAEDVLRKL